MDKKLLILGGAEVHCKVVNAAREMGIYTIVTDYLEDSPAKLIADESIMISILDTDKIVEWCRKNKIDGVINYCNDPAQKVLPIICKKLGLPCYATEEQVDVLTDKVKFKRACRRNNVDVIKDYSLEDVLNRNVEYPIIVKPNDSRGSRGQTICYSEKDIGIAIQRAQKESRMGIAVIEQYLANCQDFSVTYYVCDGRPYLIRVCDRYTGNQEENLNRQCIGSICPSKYCDLYTNKVHNRVVGLIESLGIKNGPVFMQGFVDGDTIRFYDPGFRFPGGEYEMLLKEIYGVDFVKAMIELAIYGKTSLKNHLKDGLFNLNGRHSVQLPIAGKPGIISKFDGINSIRKMSQVIVASQYYNIGDTIPDTGDVKQRIARVSMVIEKNQSVKDCVKSVQKMIKVEDENRRSLLATPLNIDNLSDY